MSGGTSQSIFSQTFFPLYSDSTLSLNVGTGSETLKTYTLPANTLSVNGQSLEINFSGRQVSAPGNSSFELRLGGNIMFGASSFSVAQYFNLRSLIVRISQTSQRIYTMGILGTTTTYSEYTLKSKDFGTNLAIAITGTSDMASNLEIALLKVDKKREP